jgi:hypothetical protein
MAANLLVLGRSKKLSSADKSETKTKKYETIIIYHITHTRRHATGRRGDNSCWNNHFIPGK